MLSSVDGKIDGSALSAVMDGGAYCSVPRRVSTSSGDAMPGDIGVAILYCYAGN
jgi:hypothetical protein